MDQFFIGNAGRFTNPIDYIDPMEYVNPVTGLELQWMIIFPKSSDQSIKVLSNKQVKMAQIGNLGSVSCSTGDFVGYKVDLIWG